MAGPKVSIPNQMQDWVDARVRGGEYQDASDYIGDLIRLDRERHEALVQALIEGRGAGSASVP
jgi:antitoxin ParD1/3/4